MKKSRKGAKKSPQNYTEIFKFFLVFLLCIALSVATFKILGYFFGGENAVKTPEISQNLEKFQKEKPKEKTDKITISELKILKPVDLNKTEISAEILKKPEILKENEISKKAENLPPPQKTKPRPKVGKMVIIIDDVSTYEDAKNIKKTGLKITPSFFPKTAITPNTPEISRQFENFMIHLPLLAKNYTDKFKITLKPSDSSEKIENLIAKIRADFPRAKFINNHTGSEFTSNENATERLFDALLKHGFKFVDSRTSSESKVEKIARKNSQRYIFREVFLDNTPSVSHTKQMLKKAVAIAQKKGFVIAIGHPKSSTFEALRTSAEILSGVEIVYLDEIYEYYK